jgi:hypothetical protein
MGAAVPLWICDVLPGSDRELVAPREPVLAILWPYAKDTPVLGERGFALYVGRCKTLRHAKISPPRNSNPARTALVPTHVEHNMTARIYPRSPECEPGARSKLGSRPRPLILILRTAADRPTQRVGGWASETPERREAAQPQPGRHPNHQHDLAAHQAACD